MAKHADSGRRADAWQFLANGRFQDEDTFIRNAPGLVETDIEIHKSVARDDTVYCGKEGVKKHGYYWRRDLPQPNPRTYLSTVYVPGCDWEPEDDSHLDDDI